jgi:hypothetical protein
VPKILVDEDSKKEIIKIIDSWRGKLTWESLCQRVSRELKFDEVISRHTLLAYDEIKLAFSTKKTKLKTEPEHRYGTGDSALQKAYERIQILESENQRLERVVGAIREQFVRWQYNLYRIGVDMEQVNKNVDRPLVDYARASRK